MRRTYTAPVAVAAAAAVAWLLATTALTAAEVQPGTRPIPDELAEIREHVRRANEEIRAVESTLEHRSPHSTVGNTAERIKDKLTGLFTGSPSAPSSITPGSIVDGAKDTLGRAYEKTRNAIVTPEQYDQFMHRLKVALGTEEPTVWEKVRGAFGYDKPESAMEQLKRAVGPAPVTEQTLTERLSNALSSEPASRRSGLWTRIKSAFGAREPSTLESLTGTDVMHKIKTAVGAEDPTVWESIRTAIEPHRSIMDRVLHPFSSSEGLSISNVVDRVGESLSSLDPTHRDTVMEKIRKAVGLQEPTIWDRLHRRWGTDVQEAVEGTAHVAKEAADKADRFIRGSTYDDVIHRMKVAFGAEDPTLWEKMRGSMENVRNSLPDGVSPEKLYESLTQNLASIDPRNRESYATKIRRAVGLEQPGFVERVRDRIMGGAEQTSDALHHVAYQNVLPKIKEAIGPEKWESMRDIFDPQPSLMDKVRGVLGRPSDARISKQNLLQRATNALHDMDPTRRDSVLDKIKSALGMPAPGILERVQNQFRSGAESATETAAEAGEAAVDKAREVLHGSTYDNAMHAVKEAIGVEDPTLYERLQRLISPSESITDKVAHVFKSGTGTDLTRGQLMEKFDAALKSAVPDRYASYSQRVKRALGLEQSSFLDRAKEKLEQLFGGAGSDASAKLEKGTDSIEAALDKLRSSAPEARDKAFEELRRAVADARSQLEGRTKSLYQSLVGGTGSDTERGASTVAQIQSSLEGVYHSFLRGVDNWMNDFRQYTRYPGARGQYLLQSSSTKEGLTYHYVNDNGQEVLDVTGERADEKTFDKLKCLNEFRAQFELAPHSEIPTNSSIQLHSVNRPHVLIRATQTVNGDRYDYQFDDGQETLSVEWGDKQNADRTLAGHEAQHLLGMFRQSHGLSVKPNAMPARLRTIRTHREEL